MSSTRPVVFIHPKGTYKAQQFYFRGDDVLKEPEFLEKEKQDVKKQYREVQKELERQKKIYDDTNAELQKTDNFTVALATALGDESDSTNQNAQLRHRLAELTTEIEGKERAITKLKAMQQSAVISTYVKERAYYESEIEDLRIEINTGIDRIKEGKKALAKVVCSDEYATSCIAQGILKAKKQYHTQLRKDLNYRINSLNKKQGSGIFRSNPPKLPLEIEKLCGIEQKLKAQYNTIHRECFNKIVVAQESAFSMIDQIERMNEVLVALGGPKYDVDALRQKYVDMEYDAPGDEDAALLEEEEDGNDNQNSNEEEESKEREFNAENQEEKKDKTSSSDDEEKKDDEDQKEEEKQHDSDEDKHENEETKQEDEEKPHDEEDKHETDENKEEVVVDDKDSPEEELHDQATNNDESNDAQGKQNDSNLEDSQNIAGETDDNLEDSNIVRIG